MKYKRSKRKFIRKRVSKFVVNFTDYEFIVVTRNRYKQYWFKRQPDRVKFFNQLKFKLTFVNQFLYAEKMCNQFGWEMYYIKTNQQSGLYKFFRVAFWSK